MFRSMEIGPLVTQSVVTVGPDHSLAEAAARMARSNVGSAVVLMTEAQPGIVTERDLLRAIAAGAELAATPVERYMTSNAISASESWDVEQAARKMIDGGFRHLIVLDGSGQVRGVLSIRDLVAALLERMADQRSPS